MNKKEEVFKIIDKYFWNEDTNEYDCSDSFIGEITLCLLEGMHNKISTSGGKDE